MSNHPSSQGLSIKEIQSQFYHDFLGYIPDKYNKLDGGFDTFTLQVLFPNAKRFSYGREIDTSKFQNWYDNPDREKMLMFSCMQKFAFTPVGQLQDYEFYFYRSFAIATKPYVYEFRLSDNLRLANSTYATPLYVPDGWQSIKNIEGLYHIAATFTAP